MAVVSSFGTAGIVTTALGGRQAIIMVVTLQPYGKIVAAGRAMDDNCHFLFCEFTVFVTQPHQLKRKQALIQNLNWYSQQSDSMH